MKKFIDKYSGYFPYSMKEELKQQMLNDLKELIKNKKEEK